MASWQKIIVSGSSAELNSIGLVTSMSVGANQTIATTQAGTKLSGSFTGSFLGDGSGLTGVTATNIEFANILNKPTLVSSSGQIDHDLTSGFVANEHIDHSTVSISAGSGLSGGGDITSTRTLSLDTSSAHFTNGVKSKLDADSVVSSSAQIIAGIAGQTIAPASINATGNVTIDGDLTVSGTTTTLNTTNLLVEDRYILLNSGSVPGGNAQGGIIVQSGATPSGSAMLYSTANSVNRWGVAEDVSAIATTATQTAYVATVTDMNIAAQVSAIATYQKPGNIKVETNGDIYIWA